MAGAQGWLQVGASGQALHGKAAAPASDARRRHPRPPLRHPVRQPRAQRVAVARIERHGTPRGRQHGGRRRTGMHARLAVRRKALQQAAAACQHGQRHAKALGQRGADDQMAARLVASALQAVQPRRAAALRARHAQHLCIVQQQIAAALARQGRISGQRQDLVAARHIAVGQDQWTPPLPAPGRRQAPQRRHIAAGKQAQRQAQRLRPLGAPARDGIAAAIDEDHQPLGSQHAEQVPEQVQGRRQHAGRLAALQRSQGRGQRLRARRLPQRGRLAQGQAAPRRQRGRRMAHAQVQGTGKVEHARAPLPP
ncbi:hypothetical protein JAB9_11040 [Janthinobacterium sp. HH107]|nr:hypothetical protein JAB9_11040 [Janthinobacterium sp. HH107]